MSNRVVVTGLGIISPVGIGIESFWSNLLDGKSGIGPVTKFDVSEMSTKIAGEVKDFNASDYIDKRSKKNGSIYSVCSSAAGWL